MCVCVCLCSLSYAACNAHAPYCHKRPARLYQIFPHYFINGTIIEQRLLYIKCVFWFSLQLLSETFLIFHEPHWHSHWQPHFGKVSLRFSPPFWNIWAKAKMFHLIKFNIQQGNKSSSEKTSPHKPIQIATQKNDTVLHLNLVFKTGFIMKQYSATFIIVSYSFWYIFTLFLTRTKA